MSKMSYDVTKVTKVVLFGKKFSAGELMTKWETMLTSCGITVITMGDQNQVDIVMDKFENSLFIVLQGKNDHPLSMYAGFNLEKIDDLMTVTGSDKLLLTPGDEQEMFDVFVEHFKKMGKDVVTTVVEKVTTDEPEKEPAKAYTGKKRGRKPGSKGKTKVNESTQPKTVQEVVESIRNTIPLSSKGEPRNVAKYSKTKARDDMEDLIKSTTPEELSAVATLSATIANTLGDDTTGETVELDGDGKSYNDIAKEMRVNGIEAGILENTPEATEEKIVEQYIPTYLEKGTEEILEDKLSDIPKRLMVDTSAADKIEADVASMLSKSIFKSKYLDYQTSPTLILMVISDKILKNTARQLFQRLGHTVIFSDIALSMVPKRNLDKDYLSRFHAVIFGNYDDVVDEYIIPDKDVFVLSNHIFDLSVTLMEVNDPLSTADIRNTLEGNAFNPSSKELFDKIIFDIRKNRNTFLTVSHKKASHTEPMVTRERCVGLVQGVFTTSIYDKAKKKSNDNSFHIQKATIWIDCRSISEYFTRIDLINYYGVRTNSVNEPELGLRYRMIKACNGFNVFNGFEPNVSVAIALVQNCISFDTELRNELSDVMHNMIMPSEYELKLPSKNKILKKKKKDKTAKKSYGTWS